jgi:tyrosinase
MDKQGIWIIRVIDPVFLDQGFLNQWSLHITNALQPVVGGGQLELTTTKPCPTGTKLEIYCRAWDHKVSPPLGVDGYIPCWIATMDLTAQMCAQDICASIVALYAASGVTINCTVAPDPSGGYKMTMSYPPPNTITWGVFSINRPSVQIEINNTPAGDDDYVTWAPTIARARVQGLSGGGPHTVVLTNDGLAPPAGGDVKFASYAGPGWPAGWPANTTATAATLTLSLPASGAWVPFVIAGDFANPSEDDKDAIIEIHEGTATGPICGTRPLMVRVRKNATTLTTAERDRYLAAIAALRASGAYAPFVDIHAASIFNSQAHGTPAFLPWHRAFVLDYERELQAIDPSVSAHYWKYDAAAPSLFSVDFMGSNPFAPGPPEPETVTYAVTNPLSTPPPPPLPATITRTGFRDHLGNPVTDVGLTPDATVLMPATFLAFQVMEGNPHGTAHVWAGGWMGSIPTAVIDPLFFMLHANVDRQWAAWQGGIGTPGGVTHHGNGAAEYNAQGAFTCPPSTTFPLGGHLNDTMWPWNGLTGPGFCAVTTLDDRPATAPGGPLTPPAAPGFLLGPPAVPTPNDVIDYLGRTTPTTGLGFCYDIIPYN